MTDFAGRIARAQAALTTQGAALMTLGATDQMRYLTGWAEYGHERLVALFVPASGEPVFVVPTMHQAQAGGNPAGLRQIVTWDDATGWQDALRPLLTQWLANALSPLMLIDEELYSGHLLALQKLEPDARYDGAGGVMTGLRAIKTEDELAAMQKAADRIDAIMEAAIGALREGMTEIELADHIRALMKRDGTREAFNSLVCFGANGAHPHHSTGETRLVRGDMVIFDIGCMADGYPSDITRTVAFGPPRDPDAAHVYAIVSEAHWQARDAARAGVSGATVDGVARGVITAAGFGPQFVHRTGHGIGLSTHEPPNIVGGSDAALGPGMCFSIEPGIYLPGRFGVRIENIVTLTSDGLRSFNADPPRELRVVPA